MMSTEKTSERIGFFGFLALIFITLKLCEVIDWSWWWVLAPLWAPLAIVLLIVGPIMLTGLILILVGDFFSRPKK
jgi:hypothetical protein